MLGLGNIKLIAETYEFMIFYFANPQQLDVIVCCSLLLTMALH